MTAVRVHGIAAGGDGVARLETGMTVFIPRTVVGDLVEVEVVETRKRFARGLARRIVEPAPERVAAPCPHYEGDGCGGCQLQHLTSGAQRAAKSRLVGDALRRLARREAADPDITPAPSAWRYRSAITLHVSGDRIGYHRFDAPDRVFDLRDCHIARESLVALWRVVSPVRALLPSGVVTVALREDRDGGLHVAVTGGASWDVRPFASTLPEGVSVWWAPEGGATRVVAGPETGYPALAFAQSHPELAQQVRVAAVAGLAAGPGATVWDLYGGVGDTARLVAAAGATVVSVDADRSAIAWARNQPGTGITYVSDRVEEAVARLPSPEGILLNPPRTGAHARVTAAIERWAQGNAGGRVAYISCDPATLSRDLTRLPSLRLTSVRAFDQFPQTAHVETLTMLVAS